VDAAQLRAAARGLGLEGRPVCVHGSLRSFGWVEGGAAAVVQALLDAGCTVMAPTFSSEAYALRPDPPDAILRNAPPPPEPFPTEVRPYTSESRALDADMGAIPAAVLAMPGSVRGNHPVNSFTAVGPRARELIAPQRAADVYAPLAALAAAGGAVVLMGVGLEYATLLHLAEKRAGRTPFARWAFGPDGRVMRVQAGGCSEGFGALEPVLAPAMREGRVGASRWMVLDAEPALRLAAAAIRAHPEITHCADPECVRCNDAVLGGPEVTWS